jgi:uncharacterized protein YgiM (DUF1202 family)
MKYRVVKEHRPEGHDPLVVTKGERLRFERKPTQWKGWVWCTSRSGKSGWAPEPWLTVEGGFCVFARDYDATELSLNVGQEVRGDLSVSEWLWVRDEEGKTGWVPLECLEKV